MHAVRPPWMRCAWRQPSSDRPAPTGGRFTPTLGAVAAFGLLSTSVVHSAPWSCDGTHCGETGQHSSYTFQLSTETEAYELNPSERTALDVQTPLYEQLFELIYEIPRKEGQPDA